MLEFADVRELLRKCPVPLVLVGGQAVNAWADYFADTDPGLRSLAPFTSADIDFAGTAEEARALAETIGARIHTSSMDDATPSTAILHVEIGGDTQTIDFITAPAGVPNTFRKDVVPLEVDGVKVHVLHPVDCLRSRIANVAGLGRTDAQSIRQLNISVRCAKLWTEALLAESGVRPALKQNEVVFRIANTDRATQVFASTKVEVFDAVSSSKGFPDAFHSKRFPVMRKAIDARRARQTG